MVHHLCWFQMTTRWEDPEDQEAGDQEEGEVEQVLPVVAALVVAALVEVDLEDHLDPR